LAQHYIISHHSESFLVFWLPWSHSHCFRWEDSDDDCNVLAFLSCDQIYQGTPDLICQCAPQPPPPAIWIQNQAGLCLMAKDRKL